MFGFLNIYKPKGITSHDVVAILRRIIKIKQIGHTGTLDPFAEGVLPICIGKATRLIEYLKDEKAYIGTIKLGESTTTFDIEGEAVKHSNKIATLNEIKNALTYFEGEIEQTPPIYSALKVNGKKLYEYARQGEDIEVKARKVTINKIELINYNEEEQTLEILIDCSKGTYIRSIANDLGEKLGTYGHLIKLTRIKAGDFDIKNSIELNELDNIENVKQHLLDPLSFLNYPKYFLNEKEVTKVKNGNSIKASIDNGLKLLIYENKILAMGYAENGIIKCKKVF